MVAVEWRGGGGGIVADLVRSPLAQAVSEKRRRERVREALEIFGLRSCARERAGRLTIGQIRLLEMARAIVDKPQVMLLDEPTSGLDEHRDRLPGLGPRADPCRAVLRRAAGGARHELRDARMQPRRRAEPRRRLAEGTPEEIRRHPEVTAAYLGSRCRMSKLLTLVLSGAS